MPEIDEDVTGKELDRSVWAELRTLSKPNAEGVARHLVMVGRLMDTDLPAALQHAEAAMARAARVAAVREAVGVVAYRTGQWSRAVSEFRTARRLSGSSHLVPLIVDCERALGRLDKALDEAASVDARRLAAGERAELAVVVSGIRRDSGQPDAAVAVLQPFLAASTTPWAARVRYARAEAELARGRTEDARAWFAQAAEADLDGETDAAERVDELDGLTYLDLSEEAEDAAAGETDGVVADDTDLSPEIDEETP